MRTLLALSPRRHHHDSGELVMALGAASLLLRYPDEALVRDVAELAGAIESLPSQFREPLLSCCEYLSREDLVRAQATYVETFDLRRRNCLYLTYYLNGDTRRRGEALWRFTRAFSDVGLEVRGELSDFLPAVLELVTQDPQGKVMDLLAEHGAGVVVLAESLRESDSPYAGVISVVERLLPFRAPGVDAEAERLMTQGPPSEMVGLESFDPLRPFDLDPKSDDESVGSACTVEPIDWKAP